MHQLNANSLYNLDSEKLDSKTHNFYTSDSDNTSLTKKQKFNFYVLNDKDRDEVKELCVKNVPFWNNLNNEDMEVENLSNAVTNRVFNVTLICSNKELFPINKVLLKKKSSFNTLLYDTELQFEVAKLLGDNYCGPKVLGRYGDYTIQQWVEGEPLSSESFSNISIISSLASSLAKFHKKGTELAPKEWDRTPFVIRQLTKWSKHIDRIIKKYNFDMDYKELENYFDIYKRVINNHVNKSNSIANSIMFCHNDIFALNVLDIQHGIYLIDFDYSSFNYVGWDVANFFAKAHIIYNETDYPYFKIDNSIRFTYERSSIFVSVYLSQLLDKNVLPSDVLVKEFLDSVEVHMLGVHLFWVFWRLIMLVQYILIFFIGWRSLPMKCVYQSIFMIIVNYTIIILKNN